LVGLLVGLVGWLLVGLVGWFGWLVGWLVVGCWFGWLVGPFGSGVSKRKNNHELLTIGGRSSASVRLFDVTSRLDFATGLCIEFGHEVA
jgi:hypothetical protein